MTASVSDTILVSFCIIAYNEQDTIANLLLNLTEQSYPHECIEVVLVNSNSTDNTRKIMEEFMTQRKDFCGIHIFDNIKRTLPCGWNVALKHATGDVILKVDAHATIPSDFIERNVTNIKSGEKITGGYRPNIVDNQTNWKRMLLMAEESVFGSGIAEYRRKNEKKYVSSLFHAAYAKEVFDTVGFFNERLSRTEDNEIHYRMRQAGYKFLYDPEIISYQHTRSTLGKMLRQKYLNGYWIGVTLGECPRCTSVHHLIPLLFVFTAALLICLACNGMILPLLIAACAYIVLTFSEVIKISLRENFKSVFLLLPGIFLLMHLCYGAGTLVGIVCIPTVLKRKK